MNSKNLFIRDLGLSHMFDNPRETDIFTTKDTRYIQKSYPNTLRIAIQGVFMEKGYDYP